MSYEHAMLLLALGFLAGVCIRPIRATLRSLIRAHRAARRATQPTRKRTRRRRTTKVSS